MYCKRYSSLIDSPEGMIIAAVIRERWQRSTGNHGVDVLLSWYALIESKGSGRGHLRDCELSQVNAAGPKVNVKAKTTGKGGRACSDEPCPSLSG